MIRLVRAGAVAVLAALCLVAVDTGPAAGSTPPAVPTQLRLLAATTNSITVGSAKAARATRYRLYVSTTRADVYVANLAKARRSATVSTPRMTIRNLTRTSRPYYFRVEALNATRRSFSTVIGTAGLQPATPTGVRISSTAAGTYLTWSSGAATGFAITQATDAAMTRGRHDYQTRDGGHQFTPYGLTVGATYYFRVRAVNVRTPSHYSAMVHAAATTTGQSVRVLTYNIQQATTAGEHVGNQVIATWAARRAGVAKLIKAANPDVLAVQEAWPWIGSPQGFGGTRQVDSLHSLLPGYALARTEVPPTEHGYSRIGDYILYKSATYAAVGEGGHWDIGNGKAAAYQELQNQSTGARFLFVSAHLIAGAGSGYDADRRAETSRLIADVRTKTSATGLPAVYAGDFNSDGRVSGTDGPGAELLAGHYADTQRVAQSLTHPSYDSYNKYSRRPPAYGLDIDRIFTSPGVAVPAWGVVLDLVKGKFVGTIPSDHNPVSATVIIPH